MWFKGLFTFPSIKIYCWYLLELPYADNSNKYSYELRCNKTCPECDCFY